MGAGTAAGSARRSERRSACACALLRVHTRTARHPVGDLAVSEDGWITFTDLDGQRHRWWHHDAGKVIAAARNGSPFVRIGTSMFLTALSPSDPMTWVWFGCAVAPTACRRP